MIKHIIALVSLSGLLAGHAAAADMSAVPYAPAPALLAQWSGFHVGAAGGWGRGTASHDQLPFGAGTSGDFTQTGWIAGGTVGYDWQFGTFTVGVEGDISAASIDGNVLNATCNTFACRTRIGWLHTGRARVGVAFGQFMPYITGGIAAAGLKAVNPINPTNSEPNAVWGGVVGGGVEVMFLPHWSAKAEYLYIPSFGSRIASDLPGVLTERNISLVRFGVNYHFGEPAVTARY